MNKSLKYSLVGFAAIIITAFLIITFSLDYLVKSGIESTGTEMMQTQVMVESVSISPFSGSGTIEGLRVKNPEGFESDYAIVIESFDMSLNVASILSDTIIVNEIEIDQPALSVIQKVPENNLRMLMNNLDESMGEESASSTGMIIEHLIVKNGQVSVTPNIGGERSAVVKMGNIELQNVGKQGSSSTAKVIREVASRIINEALNSALSGQIEGLKNKAKDAVKDIFNQ
ncbi:MAG: DUF748 domain-containing protein [Candidatus Halalkalibacterium sp. M3_1C_030]